MKKLIMMLICCFSALMIAGCHKPRQIPMHGAAVDDPTKSATLQEGSLLFRALDGKQMPLKETPNPFAEVVYAITAGRHKIGAINIQGGHVALPENMKCYSFDVELEPGVEYLIAEDKEKGVAYIKRKDTDQRLLEVKPFDKIEPYENICDWKSQ